MTWFRVDDDLSVHPKVAMAGNEAMGLWVRAGSWAAHQLTDGFIPDAMVAVLGGTQLADVLVSVGLWDKVRGGYLFHDWEHYQPDADTTQQMREKKSAAGAQANHKRWHVDRSIWQPNCAFCQEGGDPKGIAKLSQVRSQGDR